MRRLQISRLVHERRNSSALAMELRLSYTKPLSMGQYKKDLTPVY